MCQSYLKKRLRPIFKENSYGSRIKTLNFLKTITFFCKNYVVVGDGLKKKSLGDFFYCLSENFSFFMNTLMTNLTLKSIERTGRRNFPYINGLSLIFYRETAMIFANVQFLKF